jgi:microcystin-dependent protein
MAITENTYTGNGSTVLFSFTFPYLETTDIKVSLNGTLTTAYTLANATTVQFNTAPANGAAIRIYRDTDDANVYATFFPGSAIRSEDLNNSLTQVLYKTQETVNFAASTDASAITATAASALSNSQQALTTANTASATANGIASTANSALSASTNAVNTANSASNTATSALSVANSISATATAALPKAGGTMTGQILGEPSASASTPGYAFASDSDTGVGHPGANELSLVTGGVTRLTADSGGSISIPGSMTVNGTLTIDNGENVKTLMPAGAVQFFARNSAPTGWIKANGATVSRTTYAALFAAIGTTFGAGDGSTTFVLPDLRGEFPRAWDDGRGIDTSRSFGSSQAQSYQSHSHGVSDPGHAHSVYDPGHSHGVNDPGHSHSLTAARQTGSVQSGSGDTECQNQTFSTNASGTGISINGSGTNIGINGSITNITVQANGSTETRPRNIALLACIKY